MLRRSLLTLSFACAPFFAPSSARAAAPPPPPDELLVMVRESGPRPPGATVLPDALTTRLLPLGLVHDRTVAAASPRRPWSVHLLRSQAPGIDPFAAAADLQGSDEVIAAIPNYRLELFHTFPNDPMRTLQWHVDSGDSADIELTAAWDVARGDTGTVIGIMDTGVDLGHPDLASKIWTNWLEQNGVNGVDDDGNGLVDDKHGWDFGNDDSNPNPEATIDEIGLDIGFHGTFVAGLAAAATNNALGISGAGWNCRIMPLKVSDSAGEITSDAVAGAFAYATDFGIQVLNMSLGSKDRPGVPEFFQALVNAANAADVMCIASAGNDGADSISYPAANQHVLSVAATDELRARASFSNFGSWVDLAAPGQYLWSSICRNYVVDDISQLFYILFFEWDGIDPYMRGDGTSFACPITSGVAGLVRTLHPLVPPDFIADHLVATGDFIAFDEPIGPKLNAWRAVSMPVAAADDPSPVLAGAVSVLPQPMRGAGVVRFALPAASHARLEVFDLAGRRVRTLHDGAMAAGEHRQSWDGRDDHGLSLPDGVYLIRLESGSRSAVTRAVLLRR